MCARGVRAESRADERAVPDHDARLADLVAHGLIRGSFVPPAPIQELRDLTRTRKQLVRQMAQHCLRLQKTLARTRI